MFGIRQNGVYFANSHSLFPTFTTPNASAIATGHYLGDTGDFSNTVYAGYPLFNTNLFGNAVGTQTPFLESDPVLADVDNHYKGNYLTETTLLTLALQNGYSTASVGKVGPVGIQVVTQVRSIQGTTFANPYTVIIDDATGTAAGVPISASVVNDFPGVGLSTVATPRNQPSGTNAAAGALSANFGQQNYFADSMTKVILPNFKRAGKPFAVLFWSRDPDGTQHNQGDSLNSLTPGINGPTSLASITNADNDLKQIYTYIQNDPTLAGNTDIFVTADHGFATISKHEVDAKGTFTASYSTKFTYKDATGRQEVNTGFLPAGFLAIDLANALNLPLFDPDSQVTTAGVAKYMPVNPTIPQQTAAMRQRPASGNGLIGGTGAILNPTDASIIIAANGGSDLIYVPSKNAALVQQIVTFLSAQDYVDGLFVDDSVGAITGALPMSSINLIGSTSMPTPTIAVNFKTFSLDPTNPLQTAVQIADSTLQEGQGMHGTLSRDNTFNNMAAIGPDFKTKYVDNAPISNADIVPTLAQIMGLTLPSVGKLTGRVITEALLGQPDATVPLRLTRASTAAANGRSTNLVYQQFGNNLYFDQATLSSTSTLAVIANKNITTVQRAINLDATQSVASDGGALTYQFSLAQNGAGYGSILNANTATPTLTFLVGGTYTVTLTVTDSRGVSSTDSTVISYIGH